MQLAWRYLYPMSRFYYLFAVLCAVVVPGVLTAQRVQRATATERLVLPRTVTMEALEARCIEQARLKAIGDAFGYTVSEATLGRVLDTRTNFTDDFSVLTRTTVEGEWLGDMEPPVVKWSCEDGELVVTATVHGRIRAFGDKARVQVEFAATGADGRPRDDFRHGDALYALFRSAKDGHLSVFYVDHAAGQVVRLLPAAADAAADHLTVRADKPYRLFDRTQAAQFPGHPAITEVVLEVPVGEPQVIDELVAVYTPEPHTKPLMSTPASAQDLPAMPREAFEGWLTELRRRDPQAVVKRVFVTVVR